jgi:hypothetical protein
MFLFNFFVACTSTEEEMQLKARPQAAALQLGYLG